MSVNQFQQNFIDSSLESLLTFLEISSTSTSFLDVPRLLAVTGYLLESSESYSIKPQKLKRLMKIQEKLLEKCSKPLHSLN